MLPQRRQQRQQRQAENGEIVAVNALEQPDRRPFEPIGADRGRESHRLRAREPRRVHRR